MDMEKMKDMIKMKSSVVERRKGNQHVGQASEFGHGGRLGDHE